MRAPVLLKSLPDVPVVYPAGKYEYIVEYNGKE